MVVTGLTLGFSAKTVCAAETLDVEESVNGSFALQEETEKERDEEGNLGGEADEATEEEKSAAGEVSETAEEEDEATEEEKPAAGEVSETAEEEGKATEEEKSVSEEASETTGEADETTEEEKSLAGEVGETTEEEKPVTGEASETTGEADETAAEQTAEPEESIGNDEAAEQEGAVTDSGQEGAVTDSEQEGAVTDSEQDSMLLQESSVINDRTDAALSEEETEKTSEEIKKMKLEVIDFGSKGYGDGQMLTSGGKSLLIDTYVKESWETLNYWLSSHSYRDFDIYISHYHDDHMDNITRILNTGTYNVSKVYLPDMDYMTGSTTYMTNYINLCNSIINTIKSKGVEIVTLKKGSSFSVGDVEANVLWGTDYTSSSHDVSYINNNSLVTKFTCGETRYLNAGDIQKETELQILSQNIDLKAEILKLNHHGGPSSNTDAFLTAVDPIFLYYDYCGDSPTEYCASDSWARKSALKANNYGNVASVRYNGDITYEVYDNIITQNLTRNYTEQTVYLYDKEDSNKIIGVLTQHFNNACTRRDMDRPYGDYDYSFSKRDGATGQGWLFTNGGTKCYYKDGALVKGWLKTDGNWYYFDTLGKMKTGWLKSGGKWYVLKSNGEMATGWVLDCGHWYYMDQNGAMSTGWVKDNGKWYYLDAEGHMKTGWLKSGGKWYLLKKNGEMLTGWYREGGYWYYMDQKGAMSTGWVKDNGKWYYLDAQGHMKTGWLKSGGKWYLLKKNGEMLTGWYREGGHWYYMDQSGAMRTGWVQIDNKWYYFNAKGYMTSGN